nr:amidohydrolase [Adhaeribacter aquaticus]
MQDLTITLIQTALRWHSPEANRHQLEEQFERLGRNTDLIILPEMFTTGFTMEAPNLAESMAGPTMQWLTEQAAKNKAVITGSLIIQENGQNFNRLIWMRPDGSYSYYDKRHLFRMANEHHTFGAGTSRLIEQIKGWNICPLICYDLRFPIWSRNLNNAYDLLIYIASWPDKRSLAWKALLQARAIENLAYVAGVNRVGVDGNGIYYSGGSVVHGPSGEILWQRDHAVDMHTIRLSKSALEKYREVFPAYLDADSIHLNTKV